MPVPPPDENQPGINRLLKIMAQLRNPDGGCPWDLEQDFSTISPYTIEEAFEVADAIDRNEPDDICDELGDLLLQVVFQSQIASEKGLFDFEAVAAGQSAKLVHRHPHVFGDEGAAASADAVKDIWERQKAKEKAGRTHLLDGITRGLPALMRAQKIHRKVAKVGFDWPSAEPVFDKIDEEMAELKQAIAHNDRDNLVEELGDMLFTICVLAGHLDVDAEEALRAANNKFIKRFSRVEDRLKAKDITLQQSTLEQMDSAWQEIKRDEKQAAA